MGLDSGSSTSVVHIVRHAVRECHDHPRLRVVGVEDPARPTALSNCHTPPAGWRRPHLYTSGAPCRRIRRITPPHRSIHRRSGTSTTTTTTARTGAGSRLSTVVLALPAGPAATPASRRARRWPREFQHPLTATFLTPSSASLSVGLSAPRGDYRGSSSVASLLSSPMRSSMHRWLG